MPTPTWCSSRTGRTGAQGDWSQEMNWFPFTQTAMTTSPPSCPYFYSCSSVSLSCLHSLVLLITTSWTGREAKAPLSCGCSPSLKHSPSPSFSQQTAAFSPGMAATKQPNPWRGVCNPVSEKKEYLFEAGIKCSGTASFLSRTSQSLRLTGPDGHILLACIFQSSHSSSSFAPLCKHQQLQLTQTWNVGTRA